MRVVDSHCHLDDARFNEDRSQVIERAWAEGLEWILAIGTGKGPPDLEAGVRLADSDPRIWATAGIHPHDAAKAAEASFEKVRDLCRHPKVVAVGEIGLDYHYDFSPRETQRDVFRAQLRIAAEAGKPVVIHTREAWADTIELLRETPAQGIFHCFSGGPGEAEEVLDLGFHISFAGVVTFPKAESLREAARLVPLDRLLVETDAPYLAPVPYRGKRNEPAFVTATLRRVADVRGIPAGALAEATASNFERLCLRYTK
ncbi:MAG: TatD family hydrolase [Bryobacteraceae bacterium]